MRKIVIILMIFFLPVTMVGFLFWSRSPSSFPVFERPSDQRWPGLIWIESGDFPLEGNAWYASATPVAEKADWKSYRDLIVQTKSGIWRAPRLEIVKRSTGEEINIWDLRINDSSWSGRIGFLSLGILDLSQTLMSASARDVSFILGKDKDPLHLVFDAMSMGFDQASQRKGIPPLEVQSVLDMQKIKISGGGIGDPLHFSSGQGVRISDETRLGRLSFDLYGYQFPSIRPNWIPSTFDLPSKVDGRVHVDVGWKGDNLDMVFDWKTPQLFSIQFHSIFQGQPDFARLFASPLQYFRAVYTDDGLLSRLLLWAADHNKRPAAAYRAEIGEKISRESLITPDLSSADNVKMFLQGGASVDFKIKAHIAGGMHWILEHFFTVQDLPVEVDFDFSVRP